MTSPKFQSRSTRIKCLLATSSIPEVGQEPIDLEQKHVLAGKKGDKFSSGRESDAPGCGKTRAPSRMQALSLSSTAASFGQCSFSLKNARGVHRWKHRRKDRLNHRGSQRRPGPNHLRNNGMLRLPCNTVSKWYMISSIDSRSDLALGLPLSTRCLGLCTSPLRTRSSSRFTPPVRISMQPPSFWGSLDSKKRPKSPEPRSLPFLRAQVLRLLKSSPFFWSTFQTKNQTSLAQPDRTSTTYCRMLHI